MSETPIVKSPKFKYNKKKKTEDIRQSKETNDDYLSEEEESEEEPISRSNKHKGKSNKML